MKKTLLSLMVIILIAFNAQSQVIGFHENFEPPSGADSVISSGTTGYSPWGINSRIARSGVQCDSVVVSQSDTSYLTTIPFSTVGNTSVFLHFSQICKIEYNDVAEIFVSNNNGVSWIKLTAMQYMSSGTFGAISDRFTSTSYIDWLPGTTNAVPQNSWWKDEVFDISAFVANSPNVLIRFALHDNNNNGAMGNAGWYLDDIKVVMSPSELIPPVLTLVPTIWQDTIYQVGPYPVKAVITDISGIDTAYVIYTVNNGTPDTVGMSVLAADTFRANLPFPGFGRTIHYRVVAIDASPAANTVSYPSASGWNWFYCKFSIGGTFTLGTGVTVNASSSYPTPYGNWYYGSKEQYLIRAGDLSALGMPGGSISSLAFDVSVVNACPALTGFYIKMAHTSLTVLSAFVTTGLTNVYTSTAYQPVVGWNAHTFQTPFNWNGTDNIIVEVCFNNSNYTSSGNAGVKSGATSYNSTANYHGDDADVCTAPGSPTLYTSLPNMKIEIQGANSVPVDIGVSQLVYPTGGVTANQNFNVQVKLKNYGTDTISSAIINWKLDGNIQMPFNWTGTLFPGDTTVPIIIGAINLALGNHSLKIWSDMPNTTVDMNSGNDSVSLIFFACASQLSGTYTIGGTGADFPDFTSAATGLSQCGISGPVVFNVADGIYTEQIEIPWVSGSSAVNTVLFKSAGGDSSAVTLRFPATVNKNYTVRLRGTTNIEFRKMTFEAQDTAYARVVLLGNKVENLTFTGMVFKNSFSSTASSTSSSDKNLIHTLDSVAGSITIEGNLFENGNFALNLAGNAANQAPSVKIQNNQFVNQVAGGLSMQNLAAPLVKANDFVTNSIATNYSALIASNCDGALMIERNKINAHSSMGGYGITLIGCDGDSLASGTIVNNFVRINTSTGANTLWGGLVIQESTYQNLYYNNVNTTGSYTNSCALILYDATAISSNLNIVNNNFVNLAGGYLVYANLVDTSRFYSDFNNFYGSTLTFSRMLAVVQPTFAAWKASTLKDANSLSIDPYYTSAADLHVNNNLLNATAIPIASVPDDIDGDVRHATLPDIGADEFMPSPWDATISRVVSPVSACGMGTNETVTILVKNIGSTTISGNITASYKLGSYPSVTEAVSATLVPNDSVAFSFAAKANLDVFAFGKDSTFKLYAWVDLQNDPVKANDTIFSKITSHYQPAVPTIITPISVSYGNKATLNAVSPATIKWFAQDTSSLALHTGATYISPMLYDTTIFWVAARSTSVKLVTLGTGTIVNSTTGYPAPYGNWYKGSRHQMLVLSSELLAMGAVAGPISSLAFDVQTINGVPLDGFTIKLGHTTQSALSTGAWIGGLTSVYSVGSYTDVSGWNIHTFQTPFIWDGSSNIVIETCFDNSAAYSYNALMKQSSTPFVSSVWSNSDLGGVCTNATSSSSLSQRPNMQFMTGSSGCSSPRIPFTVNVINFPTNDAGITRVVHPAAAVPSGVDQAITFKLKNFGIDTLKTATINWMVNWVAQPAFNWTGNLVYKDSIDVIVDTLNFSGGVYYIVAYTTLPNGVVDTITSNDTASVVFNACLNGTYTIGDTTGGASFDFPSFTAAKNALAAAGVCGHVVFNVANGIYTEQVAFTDIPGSSLNSTITFQSLSGDSTQVIWQYQPSGTADNYVVKLDGVKYLTLNGMTLRTSASSTSSYGNVVLLTGLASYNTITNCVLQSSIGTSSNANPIYHSGTTIQYNTISNNRILNGYYGIRLYGVSTSNLSKGNRILNNTVEGFYYYGMYFYYQDSIDVSGNTLNRQSGFLNGYGIYAGYCQNESRITKNKIYLAPTGTLYGGLYIYYCTGTAARRGLVANNFVSLSGTSTAAQTPVYIYYSNYQDVLFNSVNQEAGSATSYGLRVYYGSFNNILNNNVRSTTGYAYYVDVATAISSSNYNNIYSSGTNFAYWAAARTNMAALQAASGMDVNSHAINVPFISATDLHILSTALSSKGLASVRVPDDIDGELRAPMPTIGADEVPLIPVDGGVSTILLTGLTINEFDTVIVRVIVCNYGSDTLYTFPVSYSVNGGTPVTVTYNGILPSVACDTLDLPYFISPAGNSSICAKTHVVGDTNFFNDESCKSFFGVPQNDAQLVRILTLAEGCGLASDTVKIRIRNLGATPITSNLYASYKVVGGTAVFTQQVPQAIPVGDSTLFTFTSPVDLSVSTVDSVFSIKAWLNYVGDNVEYNDSAFTTTKSFHTPPAPIVSPITVPYGSPATLTAVSPTGDTLLWFDQEVGGNQLNQGSSYTTPIMYTSDTLWVEARGGAPAQLMTLGTGTIVNSTTGYPAPYGNYYNGVRTQMLVLASELLALGSVGGPISSLAFSVQTANGVGLPGFTVKLGHTTQSALATSSWVGGLTSVYSVGSYTDVSGWNTHTFQTPFIWDGSSNVVIETCFDNYPNGYTYNAQFNQSSTPFVSSAWSNSDGGGVCTNANPSSSLSQRPNMRFMMEPTGCSSTRSPMIITVGSPAPFDAGVYKIVTPTTGVNLTNQETVKVRIKNYGTTPISNFPVSFVAGLQPVVTETVTATLNSSDTLEYTFVGKANLGIVNNTYGIKSYTGLTGDVTALNDTSYKSVMNLLPSYCPSNATSTAYEDMTNVTLHTLNNSSLPVGSQYTDFTATVQAPMLSPGMTYTMSVSTDFAPSYSTQYNCWVKAWIDFDRDGTFDPVTELLMSSATTSSATVTAQVSIPPTAMTGNTRMRVVFVETSSATSVNPCGTYSWGETEDYMVTLAPQAACDAGIISIIEPGTLNQAGASLPVWAKFMNFGSNPIAANTLSIAYKLNNGTPVVVAYPGSMIPMQIDSIQLPSVTLGMGDNTLCVYTILLCDSNNFNDEKCMNVFGELQTSLPYADNFDGQNYWYNESPAVWERGTPSGTTITSAHSAPNAWMTGLSTNYPNNANASLYTPRLDFTMLGANDTAILKFWHRMQSQTDQDAGVIQYSINEGSTWANLGYISDPLGTNWYTSNVGGTHCWSGTIPWTQVSFKLDPAVFNQITPVRFRFRFFSNASNNSFDGWAVDDFEVLIPQIANDVGIIAFTSPADSTTIGSSVTLTVTLKNFGTQPQVSIPVRYQVNSTAVVNATWAGALQPGATATYTFATPFVSPPANYNLCAWTALTGDTYAQNDKLCKIVPVKAAGLDIGVVRVHDLSYHDTTYMNVPGQTDTVRVVVKNFGVSAVSNFQVVYEINGIVNSTQTITQTLNSSDTMVVTFPTGYTSPIGYYTLCGRTILTGDANPSNNSSCLQLIGKLNSIGGEAANGLTLAQNRPNPAADNTTIEYSVPRSGKVVFEVHNLLGQPVYSEEFSVNAGTHEVVLNTSKLPAGVYTYGIHYEGYVLTKQMIVLK